MEYSKAELFIYCSVLAGMVYVAFFQWAPSFQPSRIKASWLGPRDAHDIQWEVYR
jgi:hypothetical protein